MIADSLTHVTADGRWFGSAHDASVDRLLRELDAARLDRAVVVALADFIENDFVLEACRRDARLIPGCSFNPVRHGARAAQAFREELAGAPFRVLKLHPRLNRYDPLDPACLATLEELASWPEPLPVWIDSLFHTSGVTLRKAPVETACELADRFPHLRFVFLHAAGPMALPLADALRGRANAHIDLSFTLVRYAGSSVSLDLRWLLANFDRRILYGSDFPEIGIGEAQDALLALAGAMPAEKLVNIRGGNLERLLGLV